MKSYFEKMPSFGKVLPGQKQADVEDIHTVLRSTAVTGRTFSAADVGEGSITSVFSDIGKWVVSG